MSKHCKSCVYHNTGAFNTKYADWCCKHSNTAKKSKSICIIQNSKELKK